MSQWVCSLALPFAPSLALSPCLPSPTLSQWHRNTNAAPSLFAHLLLPPFPWWQTNTIFFMLFLAGFSHHIRLSQPDHPHSISHQHPVIASSCCCMFSCLLVIESVLMPFCSLPWKLVLPTNPFLSAPPLSFHCSLHPSPSLVLFSQHHSLGTHFPQYFMLSPFSSHICFSSNFLCISPCRHGQECTCVWIFLWAYTVGWQLFIISLSLSNLVRVQSSSLDGDRSVDASLSGCWWESSLDVRLWYPSKKWVRG